MWVFGYGYKCLAMVIWVDLILGFWWLVDFVLVLWWLVVDGLILAVGLHFLRLC